MCVCRSLGSDTREMGPRRKASKLQPLVGSAGGELLLRPSEPKDYINELSHEVLCHIFRYNAQSWAGWASTVYMCFYDDVA